MKLKTLFYMGIRFLECKILGKRYPLAMAFELTNRCNLSCSHCYNVGIKKEMGKEDHIRILEEVYQAGCRIISFTGGLVFFTLAALLSPMNF